MLKNRQISKKTYISAYYTWSVIAITFVFAFFLLLVTAIPNTYSALGDNVSGWGWGSLVKGPFSGGVSSGYGLVSMNDCWGDPPGSDCWGDITGGYYGLNVSFTTHEITGFAWSNSVGWICFGQTCADQGFGAGRPTPAENPNLTAEYKVDEYGQDKYNPTTSSSPIYGWAKIIHWPNDKGWLSLRGEIDNGTGNQYGLSFSTSTLQISGMAWNGFAKPGITTPLSLHGGTGIAAEDGAFGFGWFCMGVPGYCPQTTANISVPYLKTVDGDVYVRDNIHPDYAPAGNVYNGTYLIMSDGSVVNFSSEERYRDAASGGISAIPEEQRPDSYISEGFGSYTLPRAEQNYFNALGRLDVDGLSEEVDNKYGPYESVADNSCLYDMPAAVVALYPEMAGSVILACNNSIAGFSGIGQRVVVNGSLLLGTLDGDDNDDDGVGDDAWIWSMFGIPSGPDNYPLFEDGSVTFVVKGDLYISKKVVYDNAGVGSFNDLPVAAFIVEGDVFISSNISEVDANIIALGDPSLPDCPASDVHIAKTGCGAVYTANNITFGTTPRDVNPLNMSGILMARKLFLQRQYSDVVGTPAEQILYDGRMMVNPPPGFKDFIKELPVFSEATP